MCSDAEVEREGSGAERVVPIHVHGGKRQRFEILAKEGVSWVTDGVLRENSYGDYREVRPHWEEGEGREGTIGGVDEGRASLPAVTLIPLTLRRRAAKSGFHLCILATSGARREELLISSLATFYCTACTSPDRST